MESPPVCQGVHYVKVCVRK